MQAQMENKNTCNYIKTCKYTNVRTPLFDMTWRGHGNLLPPAAGEPPGRPPKARARALRENPSPHFPQNGVNGPPLSSPDNGKLNQIEAKMKFTLFRHPPRVLTRECRQSGDFLQTRRRPS